MRPTRDAVRVLLLDLHGRTLWFRYPGSEVFDPTDPARNDYWAMPGGGLQAGENHEQAAKRELLEELGLRGVALLGCLAHRETTLNFCGTVMDVRERYYWAQWPNADPEDVSRHDASCVEHRWWEMQAMADSDAVFVPRGILPVVAQISAGRTPGDVVQFRC